MLGEWMDEHDRISRLIVAARETGFTIDFLDQLTIGLSRRAFLKVMDNASSTPSYMKSNDNPYVFRKDLAPSMPIRLSPPSQLLS
jgi:hypothetical protein